jgi:putative Holliday junction resolvase
VSETDSRILALDVGEVRIGLALSDPLGITAQPLATLPRIGIRKDMNRLAALIAEHGVSKVVLGLPLQLSGEEGAASSRVREFADRLSRRVPRVRIEFWDERMSTVEAERLLIAGDVRRSRRKRVIDTVAAVLILQGYLDATTAGGL